MLETYVIYVSGQCNCACKYCYIKGKEDQITDYTWENIKVYLDSICQFNKEFNIEFLGGEPMLGESLIYNSIRYLEAKEDINVNRYVITTNGTIVTPSLVEMMKEYKKLTWAASMDGNLWMNQLRLTKEGKNTHDIVVSNFKYLQEQLGSGKQLNVHMVTHPYNIATLDMGIGHLYNIGVRHIGVGTVESTIKIGKEYCTQYIRQLNIVSKKIIDGTYQDLNVDVLSGLKPKSDVRHYVYDDDGHIIGETYGRAFKDVVTEGEYKAQATTSPIGTLIEDIREIVYNKHQERLHQILQQ